MPAGGPSSNGVELEERKLRLEERKFENEEKRRQEEVQEKRKFDRNERSYRLLELKEKRAERLQVNSLREQENKLKEKEIELNRGRGIHLSPTQGTVAVAIFGLISAILGAAISGWYSRSIETEKNDTSYKVELEKKMRPFDLSVRNLRTLILKATEVPKREDQIKNLKFFLDAGFIRDPDKKIEKISEDSYPSSTPQNTPGATSGLLGFPSFRLLKYDLPELLSRVQDSIVLVTLTGLDKESKAVKLTTTGTVINKDGDILIASRGINEITSNLDIKVALRSEGSFVLEKKSESKPALLVKTEEEQASAFS